MTKKKKPEDLQPLGCIPEILKRFGYKKDDKKSYDLAILAIQNTINLCLFEQEIVAGVRELRPAVTVTGIIVALGYCSKTSFYDDCKLKNYPDLSAIIKRARIIVEDSYEKRLKGNSPTGSIFALKNMGWSDRQVIESELNDSEKSRLFD